MLQLWILYALASAAFAAVIPIISKVAFNELKTLDSTLATTVRAIIMALFLILLSAMLGKLQLAQTISKKALVQIAFSGIAGALSWLCYFLAIKIAPSSAIPAIAALDKLAVVFVVIFSVLFLGDKFTFYSVAGAILLTLGAILISLK